MKAFVTGHEELVHDVKYDFYGKHLATASLDQHIKVFDLDPASSNWVLNDLWKAHDSLVVRVAWAHPQFSSYKIIASCSFDRTVKVWQEQADELHALGKRWIKLATLAIELYGPIYDVKFAPHHLGFKLGCIGLDGIFRIYESMEPGDLLVWALTTEIPILYQSLPAKSLQSSFCIEWCPAKFSKTEKFIVVALDQGFVYGTKTESAARLLDAPDLSETAHLNKYVKLCNLPEHNGLIRSVSWAPAMGRSYHLIATGCKDGIVRIFKAWEQDNGDLRIETVAKLNEHKGEVWGVTWNMTGTILSSSSDDGKLRMWKSNYLNEWKCMSVVDTDNKKSLTPS